MLSGRNASGQIQIAASQNRFYPLALKMVTRSEGEFYRTAVLKNMYLLIVLAAAMLYALIIALMKIAVTGGDAVSTVLVARYMFAFATLLPLYLVSNRPTIRTAQLRWHLLRGAIGFGMFVLYTLALERIPLRNAKVLNSSYVLFVPLLLLIFLRLPPSPKWGIDRVRERSNGAQFDSGNRRHLRSSHPRRGRLFCGPPRREIHNECARRSATIRNPRATRRDGGNPDSSGTY